MINEMREKLSREVDQLSHELNVLLPQAIAQAVALGDLRENYDLFQCAADYLDRDDALAALARTRVKALTD